MSFRDIPDFALERYFARWEFGVKHQLSASDVEPLRLHELLALANADARERWENLSLGYTQSSGLPELRHEIAQLHPGLSHEDVLIVSGAQEGIFLAYNALVAPGDEVVVVTPAYQSLLALPAALGARVVPIELREENEWALDPDAVAAAVTPRTRVIAINFPHNPTGSHISAAVQRRIVAIADAAGATLLSDEVYRGLEHSSETLPPAAQLSHRAVSLGVLSKTYALAGLRIGWLATRDRNLLDRVGRLRDYTTICPGAPSEVLALVALRARTQLVDRARKIVARNLEHARAFVARGAGEIQWTEPRAGSTAFPRFTRRSADTVSQQLAESGRALLMPGSVFGCHSSYFRLGLGRTDFGVALEALESALA